MKSVFEIIFQEIRNSRAYSFFLISNVGSCFYLKTKKNKN